jgi:hypothetical protein
LAGDVPDSGGQDLFGLARDEDHPTQGAFVAQRGG